MNYPTEYKSNRIGHTFQAILAVILLILSGSILLRPAMFTNIPAALVITVCSILLMLAAGLLYISVLRLVTPLPELKYHKDGFDCKIGTYTLLHVKWEDVQDLAFINTKNEQILAVSLQKAASYIRPYRGWASTVMRARLKNYGTPVILSAKRLHISFEELQLGFVHYWNVYKFGENYSVSETGLNQ